MTRWTVIHKNCREHYATPRILRQLGVLESMITDVWWTPQQGSLFPFAKALQSRWHPDLAGATIQALNNKWLPHKVLSKFRQQTVWQMLEEEDIFFQQLATSKLTPFLKNAAQGICFAYAYTALEPFRAAKKAGWKTVLGQIDPGQAEWEVVDQATAPWRDWEPVGDRPSAQYWQKWREETALADVIIANSDWSADLLIRQGIPAHKLRVVPLLYEPKETVATPKSYPENFTPERPLRVLFLGSVCQRKGVPPLLEAARLLKDAPVQVRLIGPCSLRLPEWLVPLLAAGKVLVEPPAKGPEVDAAYSWADVFILPTHSDGFAITQLEAQARKLPVIASPYCAKVVSHQKNGWLLDAVSAPSIAECLRKIAASPHELATWSQNSAVPTNCRMSALQQTYRELTEFLIRSDIMAKEL